MHTVIKNKIKGVSLPMVIGLVSLMLLISIGANELIIRTIRSVQKIEAADRAYFAAEAGVEDALYELSPHFAGYETPDLKAEGARMDFFDETGAIWSNEWTILSNEDTCTEVWAGKDLCGKFYENQKLIISLFNDDTSASGVEPNGIGSADLVINTIDINTFSITFRLPTDVVTENSLTELIINNDGDDEVNKDGENDGTISCAGMYNNVPTDDNDCDGRENEDSPQDPVIYWKISDNAGSTFAPVRGCPTDGEGGSEICEKDFQLIGSDVSFTLPDTSNGVCDGPICTSLPSSATINDFLGAVYNDVTPRKLQIEFNIVAPMEHSDGFSRVAIPYIEYGLDYDPTDPKIPAPYFTIKSDGYYRGFKQSITAIVSPKTAVPLFDFTIIQQQ